MNSTIPSCYVPTCTNVLGKCKEHFFLISKHRYMDWMPAIGMNMYEEDIRYDRYICSAHFVAEDLVIVDDKVVPKGTACPTLNLSLNISPQDFEICRICLWKIEHDGFRVVSNYDNQEEENPLDILKVLLPDIDLEATYDPVICCKCWEILENILNFRKVIVETEKMIEEKSREMTVAKVVKDPNSETTLDLTNIVNLEELIKQNRYVGKPADETCSNLSFNGATDHSFVDELIDYIEVQHKDASTTTEDWYLDDMNTDNVVQQVNDDVKNEHNYMGRSSTPDLFFTTQLEKCNDATDVTTYTYRRAFKTFLLGNGPYLCDICAKISNDKTQFYNHKRKCMEWQSSLKCFKCKVSFDSWEEELDHWKTRHIDKRKQEEEESTFHCENCSLEFESKLEYKIHMKQGHRRTDMLCELCGKHFENPRKYYCHRKVHSSRVSGLCSECGKMFKNRSALSKHFYSCHRDMLKYGCPLCKKRFRYKVNLERHAYKFHCKIIVKC